MYVPSLSGSTSLEPTEISISTPSSGRCGSSLSKLDLGIFISINPEVKSEPKSNTFSKASDVTPLFNFNHLIPL
jgi:hypothetical protein